MSLHPKSSGKYSDHACILRARKLCQTHGRALFSYLVPYIPKGFVERTVKLGALPTHRNNRGLTSLALLAETAVLRLFSHQFCFSLGAHIYVCRASRPSPSCRTLILPCWCACRPSIWLSTRFGCCLTSGWRIIAPSFPQTCACCLFKCETASER